MDMESLKRMENREDAYMELSRCFFQGTDVDRKAIREGWDFGVEWEYPNQFALCGNQNQKGTPAERIYASLLYYSLSGEKGDPRDVLFAYAVIYNSCKMLKMNPDDAFQKVASYSSRKVADSLNAFLHRSEQDKSLDEFMLKIRNDEFGEPELYVKFRV